MRVKTKNGKEPKGRYCQMIRNEEEEEENSGRINRMRRHDTGFMGLGDGGLVSSKPTLFKSAMIFNILYANLKTCMQTCSFSPLPPFPQVQTPSLMPPV